MRFLTVVGARPQFIKAGPLSRVLRQRHEEVLVHTGQHADPGMSDIFFQELNIPAPDFHLGISGGSHGEQTGAMLPALERAMIDCRPDVVLLYGDTNSTIAGALAAAKLCVPIAHVEAGLRSFNRAMPEEINRVVTDHLSTWLFAPSESAREQLAREGITGGVHVVGDIMLDAVLAGRERAPHAGCLERLGLAPGSYYLATIHRAENTDDRDRIRAIVGALESLDRPVVLPLHPRTRRRLAEFDVSLNGNIVVSEPVGYLEMMQLQSEAAAVLTDSGGVQKEAYYLGVPCVTVRSETEWTETVMVGWNTLVDPTPASIASGLRRVSDRARPRPPLYGSGDTAERIARVFG